MPGDRLPAGSWEPAPVRDHRGADNDEHEYEGAGGNDSAEPTHHSHEAITGTPVALPTNFSNWAASVVNSPSRMVLFAPW